MVYIEKVGNNYYIIKPSTDKNKKYDVILNQKKLLSFGNRNYEHYYDKFGHYKNLNHYDEKRRELYKKRHAKTNINDINKPAFWSWNFLW